MARSHKHVLLVKQGGNQFDSFPGCTSPNVRRNFQRSPQNEQELTRTQELIEKLEYETNPFHSDKGLVRLVRPPSFLSPA